MKTLAQQLDRLVDGELSATEYRELVSSFDAQPERWKQCALAFLEAQAMRKELVSLSSEFSPAKQVAERPAKVTAKAWATWLALAASLTLTFMLGRGSLSPSNGLRPNLDNIAESQPLTRRESSITGQTVSQPGTLKLLVDEPGGEREVEIPVYDGSQVDPASVLTQSPKVPAELLQSLRKAGHDVRVERRYVPLPHTDGQQIVVPVERVHVSPKSKVVY